MMYKTDSITEETIHIFLKNIFMLVFNQRSSWLAFLRNSFSSSVKRPKPSLFICVKDFPALFLYTVMGMNSQSGNGELQLSAGFGCDSFARAEEKHGRPVVPTCCPEALDPIGPGEALRNSGTENPRRQLNPETIAENNIGLPHRRRKRRIGLGERDGVRVCVEDRSCLMGGERFGYIAQHLLE